MPRGTRAIHGAEVTGYHHGTGQDRGDEFVQAEYDYLPVACWCRARFVVTTQRDVVRGVTRSCGASGCQPPGTGPDDEYVVGPIVDAKTLQRPGWTTERAIARFGDLLGGSVGAVLQQRRFQTREKARPVLDATRAERAKSPSTRQRREHVAGLYAMGHAARSIADRLAIPVHTVWNDLYALGAARRAGHGTRGA